jgi:hypothetical protein
MECLGLHNKPKAEVHPGHKLVGPKEEEEDPKHVAVCSFYNIIVDVIKLCAFVGVNYNN